MPLPTDFTGSGWRRERTGSPSRPKRQERLEAFRQELSYGEQLTLLPFSSQTGEGREKRSMER